MSPGEHYAGKTAITKRYEALLRVSQTLISIRSSEELFSILARELRAVVNFYVMGVGIYDESAHEVRLTSYVMITVGATILALFPLALEGGPLWKPLCYAQIGGLAVATFITLLLVPVFYSIFVLDLKWIKWETTENRQEAPEAQPTTT